MKLQGEMGLFAGGCCEDLEIDESIPEVCRVWGEVVVAGMEETFEDERACTLDAQNTDGQMLYLIGAKDCPAMFANHGNEGEVNGRLITKLTSNKNGKKVITMYIAPLMDEQWKPGEEILIDYGVSYWQDREIEVK